MCIAYMYNKKEGDVTREDVFIFYLERQ